MAVEVKTDRMTLEQANAECRRIWPGKGKAREVRKWRGDEVPDRSGRRIPKGEIYAYQVGFYRPLNRNGKTPFTIKGQAPDCFERALKNAAAECRRHVVYSRIKVWEQWQN